ncbi:STAS domain-containing protein [Streptomyces sp. NPDC012769]|uniref:STAS domain-containing protein n=1 Tax=Streptomyces sp. NPDC012769 TaxID=3364848 RepID=UPI0036845073
MVDAQFVPRPDAVPEPRTYRPSSGTAWVVREPSPEPGAVVVLSATGEFDVETAGCLHDAFADARLAEPRLVVLDVSQVGCGDSSFLHELVAAHFADHRLVPAGPFPRRLRRLFALTGTLRLFTIVKDRADLCFA